MINQVIELILNLEGPSLYAFLAILLLSGSVGLPVPEDLPLLFAGKLIADGRGEPIAIFITCYLSIILGDMIIYGIGYWGGVKVLQSEKVSNHLTKERRERLEGPLARHSLMVIFLARHLFYLRSFTFLTCGALRMSFTRFVMADLAAATISVPLVIGIGYLTADYINSTLAVLANVKETLLILTLVALVAFIAFKLYKSFRLKRESE